MAIKKVKNLINRTILDIHRRNIRKILYENTLINAKNIEKYLNENLLISTRQELTEEEKSLIEDGKNFRQIKQILESNTRYKL
jgi:hypothetical protein